MRIPLHVRRLAGQKPNRGAEQQDRTETTAQAHSNSVRLIPNSGVRTPPPVKVASVEGITEYRLSNGLRILFQPEPSASKFTVNVTYRVGSRQEGAGEMGMAHLLEHMLFKGTPKFDNIGALLEKRGADSNASTWFDRTNYYETMDAKPGNLDFALQMEASRMALARLTDKELQSEFQVVRNEFEIGENDTAGILDARVRSAGFDWHPYGRDVIGAKSDIEKVPVDKLAHFYRQHYRPDNATLVVTGKFDLETTLQQIHDTFGSVVKPSEPLPETYTVEPVQDGERTVTLERNGDVPKVDLAFHGVQGAHPDFAAQQALVSLLADEDSGTLTHSLVETGIAAEVNGSSDSRAEPDEFSISATAGPRTSPQTLKKKLIAEVESFAQGSVDPAALDHFKRQAKAEFKELWKDPATLGIELSESIAAGDWRLMFLQRDRIQALTPDDVSRFARQYLKRSNRTVGIFVPTPQPDRAPASTVVDLEKMVESYRGGKPIVVGEAIEPTPEKLEARTERFALRNGLKVAVLSKRTRAEAVEAMVSFRLGSEETLQGLAEAAQLLPEILMQGPKGMTREEFQARLTDLNATLSNESAGATEPNKFAFLISTDKEHFADVMRLFSETLRNPALNPKEVERTRQEDLALYEDFKSDPEMRGEIELSRAVSPHPSSKFIYEPTVEESIADLKNVKVSQLKKLMAQAGGNHAVISIVGDVKPKAAQTLLEETFGDWTTKVPASVIPDPFVATKAQTRSVVISDKAMAWVGVGQQLNVSPKDPDYAALVLANHLLGGGELSRLNQRLREKSGLSYWTYSTLLPDVNSGKVVFNASASCPADRADDALLWMQEELEGLLSTPMNEAEFESAKSVLLMQLDQRLDEDQKIARVLANRMNVNADLKSMSSLRDRIAALTCEQTMTAARKYFDPSNLVSVKAGSVNPAK